MEKEINKLSKKWICSTKTNSSSNCRFKVIEPTKEINRQRDRQTVRWTDRHIIDRYIYFRWVNKCQDRHTYLFYTLHLSTSMQFEHHKSIVCLFKLRPFNTLSTWNFGQTKFRSSTHEYLRKYTRNTFVLHSSIHRFLFVFTVEGNA